MIDIYSISNGNLPLLVSIPHDGRELAAGQAERMTPIAHALPDTDWHVRELYGFASGFGASVIAAEYSRYVVDLNRPADDSALYEGQVSTGLCPRETFAGANLYLTDESVSAAEIRQRVQEYWQPYHVRIAAMLAEIRERHGYALLWDAHSITSEVPSLFDGMLPGFNLGTNKGASCAANIVEPVFAIAQESESGAVLNGRFCGGHITRRYGAPGNNIHAIQLELAQRTYMDEKSLRYDARRATHTAAMIRKMLLAFLEAAEKFHA